MAKLRGLQGVANNLAASLVGPLYGINEVVSCVSCSRRIAIEMLRHEITPKTRGLPRIMGLYRKCFDSEIAKLGIREQQVDSVRIILLGRAHGKALLYNHVTAKVTIKACGKSYVGESMANWISGSSRKVPAKPKTDSLIVSG